MFIQQNAMVKVDELNQGSESFPSKHRESLFSAVSAGFFFVLVGAIFVTTPNLFDKILNFFGDFGLIRVPNQPEWWLLPAPESPGAHPVVYLATERISWALGLFQIVVLVLRFAARSQLSKKTETASNLVFWLGAGFLVSTFLSKTTTATTWFVFWSAIIMLIGVSLVTRAIIMAAVRAIS